MRNSYSKSQIINKIKLCIFYTPIIFPHEKHGQKQHFLCILDTKSRQHKHNPKEIAIYT